MKEIIVNAIYRLYTTLIIYSEASLDVYERVEKSTKILLVISPVALVLRYFEVWFETNHVFIMFMIFALGLNMIVGMWSHFKRNTFNWKEFFVKNIEMFGITIIVYFLLEIINSIAGRTMTGEIFQMTIQLLTVLYPISKALKSVHFITAGKMPPAFIMNRLYKFDETGDLTDFFKDNKDDNN